jgi:hypothetical protein
MILPGEEEKGFLEGKRGGGNERRERERRVSWKESEGEGTRGGRGRGAFQTLLQS